jgi:hypothetical protein
VNQLSDLHAAPDDKGLLLYTGSPITAEEEQQFIDSALKAFVGGVSGATAAEEEFGVDTSLKATVALTPTHLVDEGIFAVAYLPIQYAPHAEFLWFNPGAHKGERVNTQSFLSFQVDDAVPRTVCTIVFQIALADSSRTCTIVKNGQSVQTLPVTQGSNQFVYSFLFSDRDSVNLSLYCSAQWQFVGAKVTRSPA